MMMLRRVTTPLYFLAHPCFYQDAFSILKSVDYGTMKKTLIYHGLLPDFQ
jgi:hypothetical protein